MRFRIIKINTLAWGVTILKGSMRTKHFVVGVVCIIAITIPVIVVLSLHPQKDHIYDDLVPLSAGEYKVQGVVEFPGENVDEFVGRSIRVNADYSLTNYGLVKIDVDCPDEDAFYVSLLRTEGEDGDKRPEGYYDKKLKPYGSTGVFSLTHGPGEYELCVWLKRNKVDEFHSNYRLIYQNTFTADFPDEMPYLYSNANSVFEDGSVIGAYSYSLIKDAKTDLEKAKIITTFVHERISYDSELSLDTEVFMTADEILMAEKGLCYHSAGLAVAMLKSVGIPAKEVRGTYKLLNGRHAWCEAYIDGEWLTGDPTCYGTFPLTPFFYLPDEFADPHN